jgi:dimethylamine/trimethylamine dehydrogenase
MPMARWPEWNCGGGRSANNHSRETPLGPTSTPVAGAPWQTRRMDRLDIENFRNWHLAAARRAMAADFDIAYAYAAHRYLLARFLNGSASERAAGTDLLQMLLDDMRSAIGAHCAIALRIDVRTASPDEKRRRDDLLRLLTPLVDLFDVTVPEYGLEMGPSRFVKEASLEADIAHVRGLTSRPVVSVGRFTSPETMLSQIKRGVLDFVGAARPSIADPFLPAKIREGRFEDIRECIGCNICYAHDGLGVPIRCSQNPTMGEEYRRGWHPECLPSTMRQDAVLILGGGPAGLEAAVTLGRMGQPVMLAEAARHLGGRINLEATLPGLSEWARVRDWRLEQLRKLPQVEVFLESRMDAASIAELGLRHVLLATGSHWRMDGHGRSFPSGQPSYADARTISVEAAIRAAEISGDVVIFDDDHYYIASTLAERLARKGAKVTYVTSHGVVSQWSSHTAEQPRAHARRLQLGVRVIAKHTVSALVEGAARLACVFGGPDQEIACTQFIPVTSRQPDDRLWDELQALDLTTLLRVGDCSAPGLIAQAVYDGHRAARQCAGTSVAAMHRERVVLGGAARAPPAAWCGLRPRLC